MGIEKRDFKVGAAWKFDKYAETCTGNLMNAVNATIAEICMLKSVERRI